MPSDKVWESIVKRAWKECAVCGRQFLGLKNEQGCTPGCKRKVDNRGRKRRKKETRRA